MKSTTEAGSKALLHGLQDCWCGGAGGVLAPRSLVQNTGQRPLVALSYSPLIRLMLQTLSAYTGFLKKFLIYPTLTMTGTPGDDIIKNCLRQTLAGDSVARKRTDGVSSALACDLAQADLKQHEHHSHTHRRSTDDGDLMPAAECESINRNVKMERITG